MCDGRDGAPQQLGTLDIRLVFPACFLIVGCADQTPPTSPPILPPPPPGNYYVIDMSPDWSPTDCLLVRRGC